MNKISAKCLSFMAIAIFTIVITVPALAQQNQTQAVAYYPLTIATVNPTTGAQQMHTIYVPMQSTLQVPASNSSPGGQYQQVQPTPLPANPWAVQNQYPVAVSTQNNNPQNVPLRDTPLPQFVGQNTTYNTAMGQEMIAPEINKTNMLLMTDHLRKLGYIVPDSLDEAIRTAPEKTRLALVQSTRWIQKGGDSNSSPILEAIGKISRDLENNYGFSFENILDNSMRILDSK